MTAEPFVQTVLGPIAPADLGPTLIHEHLLIENPSFVEPDGAAEGVLAHQPVGLANLGWIRRNWTSNADNLVLDDEALAIREVAA
ncbi:MAG TPA: phosphotriesterase-related protein, partial [Candidatus Eisenbacteria bacterium]|nr:phosphotriesterase-related protein [Candidatus Eisenbacteria bacterium]